MFTLYICKIWGVSFFKSIPHRIHFTEYTRYPEYSFNAEPWNLYLKKLNSKKKKGKKLNKIFNNSKNFIYSIFLSKEPVIQPQTKSTFFGISITSIYDHPDRL